MQHGAGEDGFGRIVRLGYQVTAHLTNGGDDLMCHPPLERLGFGLAGTQDEGIQARFGYDGKIPDLIRILYGVGRKLVFIQHF
ncbi:hypothetical protein [Bilophila wadsworthia]|uniref:hypothetical protein n=1 Tax=Bilophila wadsworthia TaxID=35833 RepID=UPI002222F8C6|nr:hypothetical protein [Bilophila wadsworthia]